MRTEGRFAPTAKSVFGIIPYVEFKPQVDDTADRQLIESDNSRTDKRLKCNRQDWERHCLKNKSQHTCAARQHHRPMRVPAERDFNKGIADAAECKIAIYFMISRPRDFADVSFTFSIKILFTDAARLSLSKNINKIVKQMQAWHIFNKRKRFAED